MSVFNIFFIVGGFIAFVAILVTAFKSAKPLKIMMISAFVGVASLVTLSLTSGLTGLELALNWWSVSTAAIFSLPGVILMLAINMIWGI